jgi:hypothetical protein
VFASEIITVRAFEEFQSAGINSNSDVYVITAISIHLSPGKLQTTFTRPSEDICSKSVVFDGA